MLGQFLNIVLCVVCWKKTLWNSVCLWKGMVVWEAKSWISGRCSLFVCARVIRLFNIISVILRRYTCMRQVIVLPHWNDPVAGIWQDHPTQSHYKLTPGRPAIYPSTHLSMPSVSKGASCTIFLRLLVCRGWGSNPQPFEPQANVKV